MQDKYFVCYAVTVNGHDASFCVTSEEALGEIALKIEDDDTDNYGIERVDGIWELIKRFGAFEDYSDDWMLEVMGTVQYMVTEWEKENQNPNLPEQL